MITSQDDLDALLDESVYATWRTVLLRARLYAQLTQADVAVKMGVSLRIVQRMERSPQSAQMRWFADYAQACGLAPFDITLSAKPMVGVFPQQQPTAHQQDDALLALDPEQVREEG